MVTPLSAARLTRLQAKVTRFLPDTATIQRTGVAVPCLLREYNRDLPLVAGARVIKPIRWQLQVPLLTAGTPTNLITGDTAAVAGSDGTIRGQYWLNMVYAPQSDAVSIIAEALRLDEPHSGMGMIPNATVTFNNPTDTADAVQTQVWLYEASADVQVFKDAAAYRMAVQFTPGLKDGAGKQVSANWEITWTQPNGKSKTETVGAIRYLYGLWPSAVAYFEVINP